MVFWQKIWSNFQEIKKGHEKLSDNVLQIVFMALFFCLFSVSAYRHWKPSAEVPPDRYDGERQSQLEISKLRLVIVITLLTRNQTPSSKSNLPRGYNAIVKINHD